MSSFVIVMIVMGSLLRPLFYVQNGPQTASELRYQLCPFSVTTWFIRLINQVVGFDLFDFLPQSGAADP
jgi:hypothetical protein